MAGTLYDEALEHLEPDAPSQPTSLYEEARATIADLDQAQETGLRRSLRRATETTPDQAAEARRLSLRLGVPSALVERNLDDFRRRDTLAQQPYAQMRRETPALATWLEDPENAKVAHDDLERLGLLEWIVTAPQRALAQGITQVRFGRLSAQRLSRELTRAEQDELDALRFHMDLGGELGAGRSWFRGAVTGAARQLPNLLAGAVEGLRYGIPAGVTAGTGAALLGQAGPQAFVPEELVTVPAAFGAGLTAGGMVGAAKFGFELEAGLAYEEYAQVRDELGQPLDRDVARGAAIAAGALNAGLEALGLGVLARSVPGVDRLTGAAARGAVRRALRVPTVRAALAQAVRSYAGTLSAETATEVAQRAVTVLAGELAKAASGQPVARLSPGQVAGELGREAAGAAQSFALLSLPGPALHVGGDLRRAQRAAQARGLFEALGEGVAQSETVKRLPEAAQAFLEAATRDGPVSHLYAPVETWTTYWQERGVDPAEMAAELTGETDALEQATRTGADLAIPTARYAVRLAGTEHHRYFADELRLGADAMNARETRAFEERLAAEPSPAAEAAAPAPGPAEQVALQVQEGLEAAGVPRATAESYAALYEAGFGTMAASAGVDPLATFEQYGLQIERPDLAEAPAEDLDLQETPPPAPHPLEARVRQLEEDLRAATRAAERDALTGVANRAALDKALPTAEAEPDTAVVAFDANHFGQVNKQLGHEAGDQMIREIAGAIGQAASEFGLGERVFRRGGDEFVVLAPAAQADAIRARAEDLFGARAAGDVVVSLTGTVGQTFAEADAGLQAAKAQRKTVDIAAAAAQTGGPDVTRAEIARPRPGAIRRPAVRRVAASAPTGRESARQRDTRRAEHDADVWAAVLTAARQLDPLVDQAALRREFLDRVEMVESLDADWRESGQNPRRLLEAIAGYGGISLEAEARGQGFVGELKWIRESPALGPGGAFGGVGGVFRARRLGAGGLARTGLSLDDMVRMLQQDAEFAWVEDIPDLLAALEDVARLIDLGVKGAVFPGTEELQRRAGIDLRVRWWAGERAAAVAEGEEFFQPGRRAILREDAPYQLDLFGEPLPVPGGVPDAGPGADRGRAVSGATGALSVRPADADRAAGAAALQRDEVEGTFPTRTQLVTHQTRQLGAAHVSTVDDAASALAYLGRGAQERFDALVTDADGTPLAVVGAFKGRINQTAVHLDIIVAEAVRVRGATGIWFAHNHPSGDPQLSPEDQEVGRQLVEAFRGTAITVRGGLAIGAAQDGRHLYEHWEPATGDRTAGLAQPTDEGPTVPVLEREFVTTGKLAQRLLDPAAARRVVPELARGEFGVVLLDSRLTPIGFLPVDPQAAAALRTEGRLDWLYRALSIAAPSQAIVHAPGPETLPAAWNLANALHASQVRVLDVISQDATGRPASVRVRTPDDLGLTGRFEQPQRGAIRFGPDRQVTIRLLAQADLSTFLHETGHLFLEVMGDLVDRVAEQDPTTLAPTQRQLLADYATLLTTFGVENRREITRAHHEQFARLFEAYLMEGKAPSLALRTAFARFRAWLLGIYRALRGLHVELTDPVRRVFDRMLATEAAITEAEAASHVAPLFLSAEAAGMSEAEFALYRDQVADASRVARETLERRLLAEVQREQQAQWQTQREEIQAAVTAEVHQQPVYRALAAIQRGTQPDGTPLVEGETPSPLKLSRAILVARYGADRLTRLPRPYIYSAQGGLDPDVVAELFGFSSGDALLTALEQTPPMRQAIEAETTRRMLAAHGSLLLDGTLPEAAQAAVANESREEIVRAELRALARLSRTVRPFVQLERRTGETALRAERREREYERRWLEAETKLRIAIAEGRQQAEIDRLRDEIRELRARARGGAATIRAALPPAALLRDQARQRIARTRVRDLRPQPFWAAARQAGQRATEAAARQDFDAAVVAKQQELLSLALYREAVRVREDVEARVRRARELGRPAARQRLGLAGESYLDQVDGILDRFEFARVSQRALDRRLSLRKWVASLEADGLPVDLPEDLLEETRRVHWRELTVEALVGVTDGLAHIVHLARLKNRLLKAAKGRALDAVAGELSTSIREHARRRAPEGARDRRPAEERRRTVQQFFAQHRKLASLLREMDGFEDGGPMWDALMRPLNEASERETEMKAEATRALGALVARAYPGRETVRLYDRQHVPAVGKSLSKMERLLIALNWGNEGNRDRVRRGERLTDAQVEAILETLDRRDWDFVQGVWDFLDSYWDPIAAKQQRVVGVAPEKVEAVPVRTKFGTFRGGYFPLKYDDRLSAKAIRALDLDAANLAQQAAYAHATTKRGHTEARQQHVTMPVRRDFGVITEHVTQVIHDLTHHEALIDVGRILGHADVQAAILEHYGDLVYKDIRGTVRDIAFGDVPAANGWEKALNHVRIGTTIAYLGWNLTTSLLQPLGLTQSIVRVGPRWIGRGVARWVRDAAHMESSVAFVQARSTFMRERHRLLSREISEIRNRLGVDTGRLTGWIDEALRATTFGTADRQRIADSYFFLIQRLQMVADLPTWLGQYEKSRAAGEPEARAIAIADQAVRDTQATGEIAHLATVQRGGPALKLWTNFYSFFSTTYNLAVEATRRTDVRHPGHVGRLAVDYLLLFAVPASLGYLIRAALRPDPDDDESLVEGLIRENLGYLSGMLLGFREIGGALQGFYGYEGPAGARAFAAASNLVRQGEQAARAAAEGEGAEGLDRAFWRSVLETAGIYFHFPSRQVQRTLEGFAAQLEGETAHPMALVGGPPRRAAR